MQDFYKIRQDSLLHKKDHFQPKKEECFDPPFSSLLVKHLKTLHYRNEEVIERFKFVIGEKIIIFDLPNENIKPYFMAYYSLKNILSSISS